MSAMQEQLNEIERDAKATLELILDNVTMLMEERTEIELDSLERNVRLLRQEHDKAAVLEEELEFERYAEERYGTV